MFALPDSNAKLTRYALDLIEQCRSSSGNRAAYYRLMNAIVETGRSDGTRSLINLLHNHLDRTAAYLFSPVELRFTIDFDRAYAQSVLDRASVGAKILTRDFAKRNADKVFARGVFESLKYGSAILKQWTQVQGSSLKPVYHKRLVMPWQFGVYREDENELNNQYAMCETTLMTMPEVYRRIYMLPDAENLMNRIKANAQRGGTGDYNSSFFHQILSTSQLNTSGLSGATNPLPGGIVQLSSDPNYSIMGPSLDIDLVQFHELWVQDGDDYTTIQLIEPDILISPQYKRGNLLIDGSARHPYTLIQPNEVQGYIWGRSELTDLVEPQFLLSTTMDDIKRLFGLQVDKIPGFQGWDGITSELYDQMRGAGYMSAPPGATITDLTPKFPPEAIPFLKLLMEIMNMIGGVPSILQGEGDSGVRAGVHANTLLKTGSPRLRDRALIVERQCAEAADLRFAMMRAKDSDNYWTSGDNEEQMEQTKFLLNDIPNDFRIEVDSHSSSPIFSDDHNQLVGFGVKAGIVDGESAIDILPFPEKDLLKARLRKKQKDKAEQTKELIQRYPQIGEKIAEKEIGLRK